MAFRAIRRLRMRRTRQREVVRAEVMDLPHEAVEDKGYP
ncbi:uncharacterized protein G2W53_014918 [Senna tora]|uniref:Uncharacterized protein n=1 Tax=Senna tora TaxID=362788 RepID=A0A834WUH8_9FABA|nr:uncharacterized protein G2W53_014918 [Senna tora]